ncbi:MAG: type IX secretion system sortase PorU, partial [Bacteroidetes bacterium]|nr:type IX secretion system sortase PorU [Bacteroidota bacterium]
YYIKVPYASVSFVPLRKKVNSSRYEKLVSFDLKHAIISNSLKKSKAGIQKSFTNSSVLASGNWYQFQVKAYGIYKLDYYYLKNTLNINVDNIDPRNIQIFGYGGGMLPEGNGVPRVDDLNENAIYVQGENDGVFNNGDYILFYGEGPHKWSYDTSDQHFHHQNHRYSDYSYYYLTIGSPGKRINSVNSTVSPNTHSVNTFSDHLVKDSDENNLIKSGSEWFGEPFDINTSQSFTFSSPNINNAVPAYARIHVIARATVASSFDLYINGAYNQLKSIPAVSQNYTQAFYKGGLLDEINFTPNATNIIRLDYNKSTTAAVGWLNFIELNVRRNLKLYGDQMAFRDAISVGSGNISEFTLSGANSSTKIWDVTDPANVFEQNGTLSGSNYVFRTATDSLKEFVAFGTSGFLTPTFITKVANQNLHGLSQTDFIIVTHPAFLSQAERLADFHRNQDNLSVVVITPGQIYHEFSSGAQDITAIRDFMRMFYERSTGPNDIPKYLLLFGDGSYDNKNRVSGNTNYIPTYQSVESSEPAKSYVSDDYYGLLDTNEGVWNSNAKHYVDIGIGRITCTTLEEAQGVVDKTINYYSSEAMGDWRNRITFIADDEDGNLHTNQANLIADTIIARYPVFNMDKIFLDAYFQVSTSAGERYPEVQTAINNNIKKGQLIINYTGHGGELGWALERILQVNDINNWTNKDRLALFVTATCEFGRHDDIGTKSGGESLLIKNVTGAIATITTSRPVFASSNYQLNLTFYKEVFEQNNGEYQRL